MKCHNYLEDIKKEVDLYMCYEKRLEKIDEELVKVATSILLERLKSPINVELRYTYLYLTYSGFFNRASKVDMEFIEEVDTILDLNYCNANYGSLHTGIKIRDDRKKDILYRFGGESFPEDYEPSNYPRIAIQKPDKNLVVYSKVTPVYPKELRQLIVTNKNIETLKLESKIIKNKLEAL